MADRAVRISGQIDSFESARSSQTPLHQEFLNEDLEWAHFGTWLALITIELDAVDHPVPSARLPPGPSSQLWRLGLSYEVASTVRVLNHESTSEQ